MSDQETKPTTEAVKANAGATPRFAEASATAPVPAAPRETLKLSQEFEPDDYDGEIDVNNLPALPWTREALGADLFRELARVAGVGDLQDHQRNPSLDPRSFGLSRAKYLIGRYRLEGAVADAYLNEGAALQEAIDELLPKISGTPRNPSAKPLRPAKTTFRESGPKPKTWTS